MSDQKSELIIVGGEITCFGAVVEYDCKTISETDGALCVDLDIHDRSRASLDTFARANITNLVITPDGELHAYNVRFSEQFVPATA